MSKYETNAQVTNDTAQVSGHPTQTYGQLPMISLCNTDCPDTKLFVFCILLTVPSCDAYNVGCSDSLETERDIK